MLALPLLFSQAMPAQVAEHLPHGLRLTNISFYGSYYTSNFPTTNNPENTLDHNTSIGGGFTLGWIRSRPRYNLSFSYSPSYSRDLTQGTSYSSSIP